MSAKDRTAASIEPTEMAAYGALPRRWLIRPEGPESTHCGQFAPRYRGDRSRPIPAFRRDGTSLAMSHECPPADSEGMGWTQLLPPAVSTRPFGPGDFACYLTAVLPALATSPSCSPAPP